MLAIIIPYYKLTFFEDTLQSLANQSDKRFAIYIGDDASPESPLELLEKYQGKFEFKYHRFEENLGGISLVQQWERCIAMAIDEEWLMILGDDDSLSPNCIKEFYDSLSEIQAENCNVVRFATVIKDEVNKKISALYTHPRLEKAADFFYRRFTNKTRSSLSEYIFKKTVYQKIGFYNYNLAWYSDDRAWLEFSEFKYIYSINSSYVSFRLSDENISRGNYKIKEKQEVTLQFFKFIVTEHLNQFKRYQQRHFLLYYEQLIYENKKATFSFWLFGFLSFLSQFYFIQSIKFTRRVVIHLRKK